MRSDFKIITNGVAYIPRLATFSGGEVNVDTVKKSAKGRIVVRHNGKDLVQEDQSTPFRQSLPDNLLKPIWRDGEWLKVVTLGDIRNKVTESL